MRRFRQKARFLLIAVAAIAALFPAGCGPSISRDQAESELADFMLDLVVQRESGGPSGYTRSTGQPWAAAPLDAAIIIWAPPVDRIEDNTINYLKTEQALRVWWFADHHLGEVTDRQAAIEQFRQAHFSNASSGRWGYYEFGILSLSNGNREAEIYLGVSCGPLCGEGVIYVLHRNDSGQWETRDIRNVWIS